MIEPVPDCVVQFLLQLCLLFTQNYAVTEADVPIHTITHRYLVGPFKGTLRHSNIRASGECVQMPEDQVPDLPQPLKMHSTSKLHIQYPLSRTGPLLQCFTATHHTTTGSIGNAISSVFRILEGCRQASSALPCKTLLLLPYCSQSCCFCQAACNEMFS